MNRTETAALLRLARRRRLIVKIKYMLGYRGPACKEFRQGYMITGMFCQQFIPPAL